jgi:hypothetical protein
MSHPTARWLGQPDAGRLRQACSPHSGPVWGATVRSILGSLVQARSDRIQIVPPSKRQRYTARICWNSNTWRFPSGEAPHLETASYVVEAGFGHEEWLFNFAWLIDGFHYAFLQPVNRSFENVTGKAIDVLLYTISPSSDRLYAGEISTCEVLRPVQAAAAVQIYQKRGWLKSMAEQVGGVGGKVENILNENKVTNLFNIRFRPDDADIYDPLIAADRNDTVWKRQRYTLAAADEEIEKQWRTRKGTTTPPLIRTVTRKGTPGVNLRSHPQTLTSRSPTIARGPVRQKECQP